MALSETTVEDKIEVVDMGGGYKAIQVRTATVISRDDAEISRSFNRHVVMPTDSWSGESTEVQAMCNTFHTAEAIAAFEAAQAANNLPVGE
tara:strand:+ start:462 stop:734 length:273 start_codon:yes stop_codon:yes gene_type:complete